MTQQETVLDPEIAFLLTALDEAYEKAAWHGPNLKGSLRGVRAQQALWRPQPERHCIWEIVVHAAYWKYAVRRRLLGEKRGSFPLKGSNWFPIPDNPGEKEFREARTLLESQHRSFREAVAALAPRRLRQPAASAKGSCRYNILGVAFHDVYHAGQIQLLKRLWRERSSAGKRRAR